MGEKEGREEKVEGSEEEGNVDKGREYAREVKNDISEGKKEGKRGWRKA